MQNSPQFDNVVEDIGRDVLEGSEPGGSQNPMLVTTNSYEELSDYSYHEDSFQLNEVKRNTSGSISEITENNDSENNETAATQMVVEQEEEEVKGVSAGETNTVDETAEKIRSGTILEKVESTEREHPNEDVHSAEWKSHQKHVFMLSEAGKPIYSRYGSEDRLVTMMGVIQALVSFVQDERDAIRCIMAGKHKFVFLVRPPLILVAVVETPESIGQLTLQLNYVHSQVVSVITLTQLNRIFQQRGNYDLRRLLSGSEKFIDSLLNYMDRDPSCMLQAVRCLTLSEALRDTIAQSLLQAKVKDLVFAILIANNQLIALVRMKKYVLHPADLHLIFNLVSSSTSFQAAESWTPICLPKFDSSGYLHAHISYLDDTPACLLMLSVDRQLFFKLSECKQKIVERLKKYNCLEGIQEAVNLGDYKISQVGILELRHFLYKSRSTAQLTSPQLGPPYDQEKNRDRLFGLYQLIHQRLHNPARPLKTFYHVGPHETLLGWVTSGFEMYVTFGPLITKQQAINAINKLLRWIKREEEKLFILNSPTF